MTFLELVIRLASECSSAAAPTTCQSQSGESFRLVNWINQSWLELQQLRDDWEFMRSSFILGSPVGSGGTSFTTTAGRYSYPLGTTAGTTCMVAVASFGMWDVRSFRCYTTTNTNKTDEEIMGWLPFPAYKNGYLLSAQRQVQTRPMVVSIGPDKSVNVGPPSNGLYTIEADYWVKPTLMVADADVPTGLPSEFHMAIVYRAMKKYAGYDSAPEVFDTAKKFGTPLDYRLVRMYSRGITRASL